uniref:Zinc finger, CCHC-type n=1 Tax=Tanacetum cinerariifolium TaxID=118510 RepID=A0A6L2LQV6_TANCI|nr:hypothetical protein [Tanacetum cinerariifolium]
MEKLEHENVSLNFQVQSLIKERDNVKIEYQKLFYSIKKTRSQTQKEIDELIAHVSEKTYAYGAIRAENQNLLFIISEVKTRLKNVEKTNSKNSAKKVAFYVRKNKQTDNTFVNVISNKENVIDVDVANASKANNLLCVSCMQNVLILCHDKCLAHCKLNVSRTLTTKSRTPKSSDTTYVVLKTRFFKQPTQSKTLDSTFVVTKSKIDVDRASKAKNKVVQIVLWIVDSGCSKNMTCDRSLLRNFIEKFMGTVCFGNDNFAAITGYGDYIQGNITIFHVYYVKGLGYNLFSVGQSFDGDLEVAIHSMTCYVRNLEGDDLLTGGHESNLYSISISDMADSSPVCLMSKATLTKSWLWYHRLSHLNFGTINDFTRLDLIDGLPKFKYEKDHLCSAYEKGKSKKAFHPPKLVSSDNFKLELLHMDLCDPMRFVSYNPTCYEAIESSLTNLEPSNVQNFHQVQPSTHSYTKDHPLDQVFGDPSKMTCQRLRTDSETKCDAENIVVWNKTRLVAKGYRQEEGIDFEESFTHVARLEAFWMLKKALYGLKQAPHAWYDKLSSFLIEHRFTKGIVDPTLFTRRHKGDILVVQVYVDDIIFGSTNLDFSKCFANLMKNNFEMSMMGKLKFLLRHPVHESPRGIFISQSQYAIELLKKHGVDEYVSMSTPTETERLDADLQGTPTDQTTYRRMIRGLMYLTASRLDIAYVTFVCARYQAHPMVKHLKEVKRIFRYFRQSYNKGLWYSKDFGFELIAYLDVDHAGCKDDCKSTLGGLQFLSGKLVSWSSKKQDCIAMSTAEAKYVSLSTSCAQVIWMRTQLLDYGYKYNRISMYFDSKSAISISCNSVQHSNTKHIDIWYHFIKEHVEKGEVFDEIGKNFEQSSSFQGGVFDELVIIMAHQQLVADVHPDELCPPNKRRTRDKYHILKDDDLMKNIFNSERYKDNVGMKIPDWMISEEMKQTKHYWMYAEVFGIDVPLIQSPLTESTQGMHRIPSAPRQEHEARENVALVEKHLASMEIEKMVEGQEHVVDDSLIPRNDEHNIPGTRLEPRSDKESPKVGITDVIVPVNVYNKEEEEDEITDEELQGRYGYSFEHLWAKFMLRKSFVTLVDHLHKAVADSLPTMVNKHVKKIVEQQVPEWVNKCVKKFNPYARYGVKHWKNPHAKIFYIRKQKEPGKLKEVIYSNSKIIQVIKTYWELGHEHKIDIEDMYLLIINRKVPDYAETAIVRLPDPKRKTLGEKGIDCIFVGYAEQSKAYRFYVIEPNDLVSINSIIESRDAMFNENSFYSIPRPKDIIPNSDESQKDDHSDDVPSEISEPRKGKRVRKAKSYGYDFQLYLVDGSRDQVGSQYSYCYSIEEDTRTYNEAMQSRDAAFWKEAIDDEIRCKWIYKKKMKVDETIDKFKARLVIQSFRQKERIDYFDTYAPIARITTIRLLLALAAIHNLVIHQMDVKTTFLNGDLDEEVYMKQPEGFVMPGNEHKVFDKTKKFSSSRFSMKDIGEADIILGIKIKRENKGIVITQSHYIEKILKKFNREDCSPVRTPMDPVEKLKSNTGKPVDQLEYSRVIGFFMYAMTSTRPDIAYVVGRLSRFTSNPSRQHWKAITRIFKYLRGTKDYGLSYVGYPSVLEGYSDASWINHVEDSSSTS